MMSFMQRLYDATPIQDKVVLPLGAAVSSASLLTQIQTVIGITVGVLTILVLIPRVYAAWKGNKKKNQKEDE